MGSYQGKVYNTPEEAEEFVKTTIEAHDVVLFTKRFSPYCYKATSSFKSINVTYEEVLLSGRPDCQIIQDVLLKMTGARTVPRVFIHQTCIGGGDETSALKKENKLKGLVDKTEENKPEEQQKTAEDVSSSKPSENQEQAASDPKEETSQEQGAGDKKEDDAPAAEAPAQEASPKEEEPQQEDTKPSQEQETTPEDATQEQTSTEEAPTQEKSDD